MTKYLFLFSVVHESACSAGIAAPMRVFTVYRFPPPASVK
jgi:hypothetical protein